MTFSIVIPAHNGGKYLGAALASSLNQTRTPDEVLIVDDASTDKTAEIAKSSKWCGRVKYFYNEKSTGFVDAWNRAISKANGDFITILHQDDVLHWDYLYHIEKSIKSYPTIRHIYTACNYMNEKGDIIATPSGPHSLEPIIYSGKQYAKNYFNGVINNRHIHRCPGVTTSRDLLINHCTYRKESGHIADDDFFLRVGAFTDVIGITYPLASFRIHSESTTSKLDSLVLELAQDYVFQACYNKENKTLLDNEDVPRLIQSTLRFINHSLFQSILYEKPDKIEEVIRLREQFETMLPSIIEFKQPAWAKLMWHLASNSGKKKIISKMYVLVLNNIIKTRNFSRDAYQCKILRNCLLF